MVAEDGLIGTMHSAASLAGSRCPCNPPCRFHSTFPVDRRRRTCEPRRSLIAPSVPALAGYAVRSFFWRIERQRTMIEHLEDEVRDELASSRHGQTRAVAVMHVNGDRLEVLGRIGPGGAIRLGYSYCGVRMERKTLLTLVCPEQSCPCRAASLANWHRHLGIVIPATPSRFQPMARPLIVEVEIRANGRCCQARPALLRCLTPCPYAVHSAIPMQKTGWDLFEAGRCIAGGVFKNPETGLSVPMLPTLEVAQTWLAAQ